MHLQICCFSAFPAPHANICVSGGLYLLGYTWLRLVHQSTLRKLPIFHSRSHSRCFSVTSAVKQSRCCGERMTKKVFPEWGRAAVEIKQLSPFICSQRCLLCSQVPKSCPAPVRPDVTTVISDAQGGKRQQAYKAEIIGGVVVHTPIQVKWIRHTHTLFFFSIIRIKTVAKAHKNAVC